MDFIEIILLIGFMISWISWISWTHGFHGLVFIDFHDFFMKIHVFSTYVRSSRSLKMFSENILSIRNHFNKSRKFIPDVSIGGESG